MKYTFTVLALCLIIFSAKAQDAPSEVMKDHSFKVENLFTGGSINASFFTGGVAIGLNPHFGYSLTRWLDVALTLNYNYTGQTDEYRVKYRQNVFAPGSFVRIYPIEFLFLQTQYEHNFLKLKVTEPGYPTYSYNAQENSLLVGVGYAQGRESGNNNFFYISLMYDILNLPNSPYRDSYGRMIPLLTAGVNVALFQGRGRRR